MRTTIDIPDTLYRSLKTQAAASGTTLRELIQRLIEQGLRQPPQLSGRRDPPPVILPATGFPIRALSGAELRRLEEEEDEEKYARSFGL